MKKSKVEKTEKTANSEKTVRKAMKAGTWYSSSRKAPSRSQIRIFSGDELEKQITLWFDTIRLEPRLNKPVKALIAP